MDLLLDPLRNGITQRALIDLLILGVVCGPLGVWVVLFRQSYSAESMAHSMLPGLVVAALIGAPLGVGAAAGLAGAAAPIAIASRPRLGGPDAAVAVAVTTLFGLGTLLALSPQTPLRLGELLFGDPLSVSTADLLAAAALALAGLAALAAGHRADARRLRSSRRAISAAPAPPPLLLALLALTTLIAVQALGNLLVVAIVIGPAAAALQLCDRLVPALATAAAFAVAAGVAGIYLSYWAELAAGASIAICAVATFGLAAVATSLRGPATRRFLEWSSATE